MKVKTLIKKLQELGDEYQDATVTIQDPRLRVMIPISSKIKADYCQNIKGDRRDLIVVLKQE